MKENFLGDASKLQGYRGSVPVLVAMSGEQTTITGDTITKVTGSDIVFGKHEFEPGCALRIRMSGVLSGGNAAPLILFYMNGTAVLTLTFDAVTAGDYMVDALIYSHTNAVQKSWGCVHVDTQDPEVVYEAAAVDTSQEVRFYFALEPKNGGDTLTCEVFTIEMLRL